jgi:hypothetical protein
VQQIGPILRLVVHRRRLSLDLGGAVTGLLHGPDQRRQIRMIATDLRAFGCQIDRRSRHTGNPGQNFLHAADAGGAGHAGYGEVNGFDGGVHVSR